MKTVEEKIALAVAQGDAGAPGLIRSALACLINPGDSCMNARDRLQMADEILGRVLPESYPDADEG